MAVRLLLFVIAIVLSSNLFAANTFIQRQAIGFHTSLIHKNAYHNSRSSVLLLHKGTVTQMDKFALPLTKRGKAGVVLTTLGTCIFAGGVTAIAFGTGAKSYQNGNGGGTVEIDPLTIGGVIMAATSLTLIIPGAMLWKKGSHGLIK